MSRSLTTSIALASALHVGACVSAALEQRLDDARDEVALPPSPPPDPVADEPLVDPAAPVDWSAITALVLARNPRLESMRAAWRAALERMPQVVASPDPMLELGVAPLSLPTGRGQRLAFRQPLAWAAALDARGEAVLAEAEALGHDREALARVLVAAAHEALTELATTSSLRALYHAHHELMHTLRRGVMAMLSAGRGLPEDAVMAEAEIVMAERELLAVTRVELAARARLNALLHRAADAPLGPVTLPASLPPEPPPLPELLAEARSHRPELVAARTRVRARDASIDAADAATRPTFAIGFELSTMSDDSMMWPMLMASVELPLARASRDAMRDEARALAVMQRHEVAALDREIEAEVATRRATLSAALAQLAQTRDALIPALERRAELVQASYAAARQGFDQVLVAHDALLDARLEAVTLTREVHLAAIALELALGRLVGTEAP